MKEGVEYEGINIPVDKLDRHDRRFAKRAAGSHGDGLDELRADVYQDREAYQAYKKTMLKLEGGYVRRSFRKAKEVFSGFTPPPIRRV